MSIALYGLAVCASRTGALSTDDWVAKAPSMGRSTDVWTEEDWDVQHVTKQHATYGEVIHSTYTSPKISLMTGAGHFTLNPITAIPFPKGTYSQLEATFRVMDENATRHIPLTEVYNHHWLVGTHDGVDVLEPCEDSDNVFFGGGAEMNGVTPIKAPEGYAVRRIDVSKPCGGNIHLIRTEDLKMEWKGMNNPNGSIAAATKNCIECGWAPGRMIGCDESLDGNIECCFTGSRCPVNHPEDRSVKKYVIQYEFVFTRDLTPFKDVHGGLFDVSGGAIEWDIAPNMDKPDKHTKCDDKICNITNSITVGYEKKFGDGMCPGTMLWSYTHQHTGAINSTMLVNGKEVCASEAIYGTDPSNTPGNELGYVVNFTRCIDKDHLHNEVRLEKGDVVTITSLYDVDKDSTRTRLQAGIGKHGGIMALFFWMMDCDAGTFSDAYHCAQAQCIPVSVKSGKGHFDNVTACEASCGK